MFKQLRRKASALALLTMIPLTGLVAPGCSSVYYSAMEQMGVHKRDLVVKRVKAARESQAEAKEQFSSALARFRSVLGDQGTALEAKYDTLSAELERSEARAAEVRDRIEAVEDVSEALFAEWEKELAEFSNAELRRSSEAQLRETRERYGALIRAMRRAEARIEPVLTPLRDNVLYLKHNLNAQAIASLEGELGKIEGDVDRLLRDLNEAIREADQFISQMESTR